MRKVCERPGCETEFEAKRPNRRFCTPACRLQAHRSPAAKAAPAPRAPKARGGTGLTRATRAELSAAGRVSSTAGQAALLLARRIDGGGAETGAALAAMIREHAQAMERALRDGQAADPVRDRQDEVAQRRERRSQPAG